MEKKKTKAENSEEYEKLIEKLRAATSIKNAESIFGEIKYYLQQKEEKELMIECANSKEKKILIRKFGCKQTVLSLSSKEIFDSEIKKYLLFPFFRENGIYIPLRSFSQLKKTKENPIIIEEGIDLKKFDEDKFKKLKHYLGRDYNEDPYLFDYKYLTLNYLLYFPFLEKDIIFNKVYNDGTYISQIDENCSKFEVLVRKYFLYGKKVYKFFLGPNMIGKTSLIHQIIHHNYLHEMDDDYIGYCYIDLNLYYNKAITQDNIYELLYDTYFMFFSHKDYISFIKDYSEYINMDNLFNIFQIIQNMISYIFKKYKERKTRITFVLDNIKKNMKDQIYKLIEFTTKLCSEIDEFNAKIKLLFCGDLSFGQIYTNKLTDLINSDINLYEESNYHIIFDDSYKIPENSLKSKQNTLLKSLNFELSSYHKYYDIITKDINDEEKTLLIQKEIRNTLEQYNIYYLFLSKLIIEKCKICKENDYDDEIRYLVDEINENIILENLPWEYFKIKKNNINITGYDILYKDIICKQVIEELMKDYITKVNLIEYKNKPNFIFGYFFEQFLINKFKNSLKFFNYIINDVIVIKSIYSNDDEWTFIKKPIISSSKCFLIIQDLINSPYYDIAIIIPSDNNFFIIFIQIAVSKSSEKREILKIEYNYQRFKKIQKLFEKAFYPYKLVDGDFCFIIYEEDDKNTIEFCTSECIKCISYYKENDIFKLWMDNMDPISITKFPLDEFTILNSINYNKLILRKSNIKITKEKKLLYLSHKIPKTKKINPIKKLNEKERDLIMQTFNKNLEDCAFVSLHFIENDNNLNREPTENQIIVYIKFEEEEYIKIGFEICINGEKKYFKFPKILNAEKSNAINTQIYEIKKQNKLLGKKRSNTK